MAELLPFRALRFAGPVSPRLAPPYDVIAPEQRESLAAEGENVVHLTLPAGHEGARDWDAAARTLERWRGEGVLVRDPDAQLYLLEEQGRAGPPRRGFLGLLRLADYEEGVVLPHEQTEGGPKRDRLLLTRSVRANLEPLFFLYEDGEGKLAAEIDAALRTEPLSAGTGPDGTALALRSVAPPAARAVQSFLADRAVIIADGHHRYETMLEYRDERRRESARHDPDAPYEFVLAYLVNAYDPGSRIRSIHRVVRGATADPAAALARCGFASAPAGGTPGELLAELERRSSSEHAFVVAGPGDGLLLARRPRGDHLDVQVLHEEVLRSLGGEVAYDAEPERVLAAARAGALGILLHPLDAATLFRVVGAGAVLPPKSTYFTPKVPSGLVIRDLG